MWVYISYLACQNKHNTGSSIHFLIVSLLKNEKIHQCGGLAFLPSSFALMQFISLPLLVCTVSLFPFSDVTWCIIWVSLFYKVRKWLFLDEYLFPQHLEIIQGTIHYHRRLPNMALLTLLQYGCILLGLSCWICSVLLRVLCWHQNRKCRPFKELLWSRNVTAVGLLQTSSGCKALNRSTGSSSSYNDWFLQ